MNDLSSEIEAKIVGNINRETAAENTKSDFIELGEAPDKKRIIGFVAFGIGIATCIAGLIFMLLSFFAGPDLRDGEYLVGIGSWVLEEQGSVVWDFSDIGKGTLTTNNHLNDYDFTWAIEGETLKIETSWLYTLNNEYTYKIDQRNNSLVLTSGEDEYRFVPLVTDSEEEE